MLTAFLAGIAAVTIKHTLFREHAMAFAAMLAVANAAISTILVIVTDGFVLQGIPLYAFVLMAIIAILGATAYLLVAKAVRHMPISISSPLLALGPAVAALFAFFILGEKLTPINTLGLCCILLGVYILEHKIGVSVGKNIKLITKQKHVKYIFLALLLYAVTSVADRHLLADVGVTPLTYLAIVQVLIAVFFLLLVWLFYDLRDIKKGFTEAWVPVLIIAVLTVSYRYTQSVAFSMAGGKVGLVDGIKRTSALLATIVGGELFHEKHLLRNFFAALVIICGVLLVIL